MARVGFIGLGVIGFPMAGHLVDCGHEMIVYNRSSEKISKFVNSFSCASAETPAELARDTEVIFCCVGNDNDVLDVTIGDDGAFKTMGANAIFVDHTTASASLARKLSNIASSSGRKFIDAPVSGGEIGAQNGTLTTMCGGDKDAYSRVETLISSYSKSCKLMGESGAGQLTKMVNQICIAGLLQGLSEGLSFAENANLQVNDVLEVIAGGAAGSWQMNNRGKTMAVNEFDFGFAVNWMRKDLKICLEEANKNGSSLPITALIDEFYKDVQNMGGGRWDTSSLIARLRKLNEKTKK
ncbi:MAG: NAD(P)-dependent oxidoreductase [Pseudomonadota bacterium]|nr:NAD(P)-dependent oxidoreductase [Pseudomonadota bacterium]